MKVYVSMVYTNWESTFGEVSSTLEKSKKSCAEILKYLDNDSRCYVYETVLDQDNYKEVLDIRKMSKNRLKINGKFVDIDTLEECFT